MKKLLLYFTIALFSAFAGFSASDAQDSDTSTDSGTTVACTQEWAPVCGQPPMSECAEGMSCAQVMPDPVTYGNKCSLKAAGAEYLYWGECSSTTEPVCPEYDLAAPPEGCSYTWYTADNGCKKPKLKCENTCTTAERPTEKTGCKIKEYKDDSGCLKYKQVCESTICSEEYAPVCGYKEVCAENATGESCSKTKKTFSNKCTMSVSGYKFLDSGECNEEPATTCPEYDTQTLEVGCYYEWVKMENGCKKPKVVCQDLGKSCRDYSTIKLMSEMNGCPIVWYENENGCKVHKYVCKEEETKVDKYAKLKLRIAASIEKLFVRLDASDRSSEAKIEHLEKVIVKLLAIIEKKPQYEEVINYAVDLLEEKIASLQEDEGIDDIFELLEE